jgi:uncharacterized membrane-anchored protein YitT (DUF2179 family)
LGRFLRGAFDYVLITVGALIIAAKVPLFLQPNEVVSTGLTGVSMLTYFVWGWPIGLVTLALNVPLLIAGVIWGEGFRPPPRRSFSGRRLTLIGVP